MFALRYISGDDPVIIMSVVVVTVVSGPCRYLRRFFKVSYETECLTTLGRFY